MDQPKLLVPVTGYDAAFKVSVFGAEAVYAKGSDLLLNNCFKSKRVSEFHAISGLLATKKIPLFLDFTGIVKESEVDVFFQELSDLKQIVFDGFLCDDYSIFSVINHYFPEKKSIIRLQVPSSIAVTSWIKAGAGAFMIDGTVLPAFSESVSRHIKRNVSYFASMDISSAFLHDSLADLLLSHPDFVAIPSELSKSEFLSVYSYVYSSAIHDYFSNLYNFEDKLSTYKILLDSVHEKDFLCELPTLVAQVCGYDALNRRILLSVLKPIRTGEKYFLLEPNRQIVSFVSERLFDSSGNFVTTINLGSGSLQYPHYVGNLGYLIRYK